MEQSIDALKSVLDYLQQPAILLRGGAVCYRNPAAGALLVEEADAASSLLADPSGALSGDFAPVNLELTLAGRRREATALPAAGGVLLLVGGGDRDLSSDTLLCAARSLREPLSSLFALSSSLFPALEELENPELQRQLAGFNRAFYQLLRLSGNLAAAGSLLADGQALPKEKTELTAYFAELLERAEPLCQAAGAALDWTLPDRQLYCWISREWVERAVLNLLSNALQYAPKGGKLRFSLGQSGKFAMLCISDNGEGLAPELLATAFSRFARQPELDDPRWGVGFGLPIARRVAQAHGGTLLVQSRDDGTAVTMSLSLEQPEQSETKLRSPAASYDYTGGFRHELVELSDALPAEVYDTRNLE